MDLEREIAGALEDSLAQFSPRLKGNRVKIYWCRRSRLKTCDLIANLSPGSHAKPWDSDCLRTMISEVVKKSEGWCVPLEKCEVVSTPVLQINTWLNRTAMTAFVLKSIGKESKDLSEKRPLPQLPKLQALVYALALNVNAESCSLTDLRSLILMELIKRILEVNSFETWTSHHVHSGGICQNTCDSGCETLLANNYQMEISARLTQSVQQTGSQNNAKSSEFDLVGHADRLKHVIHRHGQKVITACILVTPQHAEAQATAFKEALNKTVKEHEDSPSLVKLVHGPVIWRKAHPSCTTAEQLYRMQSDVLRNSFAHKYGALEVGKGDHCRNDLAHMFEHLADLNIKFHLLGCSTSKEVRLNIVKSDSCGTFVMYNYARICVLLSKFEALVPLPSMEDVDFSLLKKEEEWNLILLLAKYPKLINCIASELQDLISDSSINPSFHKIIEFMSELGHQISVYYSHVRVLMPAVHLQDVMFVRIWLLKCLKRILEDSFYLLNVTPVKQM